LEFPKIDSALLEAVVLQAASIQALLLNDRGGCSGIFTERLHRSGLYQAVVTEHPRKRKSADNLLLRGHVNECKLGNSTSANESAADSPKLSYPTNFDFFPSNQL
jgi:hypothetical protein